MFMVAVLPDFRISQKGWRLNPFPPQCRAMKIEHFALQVPDPVAMADWYVKHLGFAVARSEGEPSYGRFLKDGSGTVMFEIYRNPKVSVPNYAGTDPLLLHLAFVSQAPAADRDRLVKAGATLVADVTTSPAGDQLLMLRDPWGIALQFVKRASPMLEQKR
jgi:uncharacterized glyoxalase superfamily protein PhnB